MAGHLPESRRRYYEQNREKLLARSAQWAADNRDRVNASQRRHRQRMRDEGKRYAALARSAKRRAITMRHRSWCGCAICGEREANRLAYHHVSDNKKDTIARMIKSAPWAAVKAEIRKCVVLCLNHHRKIHSGFAPAWNLESADIEWVKN